MRDDTRKFQVFSRRSFLILLLQSALSCLLGLRLYSMQIRDYALYQTMSDRNRIRVIMKQSPRGLIYDRNNKILANNTVHYNIIANDIKDHKEIINIIGELNNILKNPIKISENNIAQFIKQSKKNHPIKIASNIPWEEVIRIENNTYRLPGVAIETFSGRFYDHMGHVVGYVGPPSEKELKNMLVPNAQDFMIGKSGIERSLNQILQGSPTVQRMEVDVTNNVVRELFTNPGHKGKDVILSIDEELQRHSAALMQNKTGAVVALDASSGEVLVLYSCPTYNANSFMQGLTNQEWQRIIQDQKRPLINRAISSTTPPGSTFKIVTALAALSRGVSPKYTVRCNGSHTVGGHVFHCWNRAGHGIVDIERALAQSCNVYFYQISESLNIRQIEKIANLLGFGQQTGIELPFESTGLIPNKEWKQKLRKQQWTLGDTINVSIGQGALLVTPLQLAVAFARLATGKNITPTILRRDTQELPTTKTLSINQQHLEIVRHGVYASFNTPYGKNYADRMPDIEFSGKSGTTQLISLSHHSKKFEDHSIFVGFAPYREPRYVVSCLVEHGGFGSVSAMPVVQSLMQKIMQSG